MRRWLSVLVVVGTIFATGQAVWAHGPHGWHGHSYGWVGAAPCYRPAVVVAHPLYVPPRIYGPPVVYRYYYRPPVSSFYYWGRHFGFGMAF